MQALMDLAPLVAFLLAYRIGGIYVATAVLMLSMLLLLACDWLRQRRIPPLHLISTVLVLVLGGATLILRDTRFLKWKPTIFLWLVAFGAAVSVWIGRAPLAQRLLQPLVNRSELLPRSIWLRLNWLWVLFYLVLGATNLAVAAHMSERSWVEFKVFGLSAALLVFGLAQALWLAAHIESLTPSKA
jgi:intracellular septation protein